MLGSQFFLYFFFQIFRCNFHWYKNANFKFKKINKIFSCNSVMDDFIKINQYYRCLNVQLNFLKIFLFYRLILKLFIWDYFSKTVNFWFGMVHCNFSLYNQEN